MSGQIDKDFRPIVKQLRAIEGIELRRRKGNEHTFIYYQGRRVGSLPTSSGDHRGPLSLRTQLRRHGVPI